MRYLMAALVCAGCGDGTFGAVAETRVDDLGADAAATSAGETAVDGAGTEPADIEETVDTMIAIVRRCERERRALPSLEVLWHETDEFDAQGRHIRTIGTSSESTAAPSSVATHRYDDAGRRVAIDYDDLADGTIDWTKTWRYDDEGRWVEMAVRTRYVDERTERDFDPVSGALVATRLFTNGSESPALTTTYTNEGTRAIAARREDTRIAPSLSTVTYTYDAQGRLVEDAIDYRDDGSIDRIWTFEYDGEDRLWRVGDRSGDRTWVEGTIITFDARGRVTRTVWDSTLDGVEQVDYRYHADADGGGLAEFDVAYPASAPPTERAIWSSSCEARPFWQDYRGNIDL